MLATIAVIAIIIAVVLAAVLIYAATRPNIFIIQRTTSIDAPAARIHPLINDFHQWSQWSPYETKDPAMTRTFSARARQGIGLAPGRRQERRHRPHGNHRDVLLEGDRRPQFITPFKARNTAEFSLVPQQGRHRAPPGRCGPLPFIGKVMHLFAQHGPHGRLSISKPQLSPI